MAEITKEELIEINNPNTVYCNRFYFSQNNSMVKITCCEEMQGVMTARFSMTMSILEFQVFAQTVQSKMEEINKQIEAFKTSQGKLKNEA